MYLLSIYAAGGGWPAALAWRLVFPSSVILKLPESFPEVPYKLFKVPDNNRQTDPKECEPYEN